MNQDSSFPPMLPPSSEFGALLFAVLPCLTETYRPLASFAYHMTELTKLKSIPSVPSLSGISGIDALVTDKDILLRSLTFYGKLFRMPLLTAIATLLQGMQFYQTYKDILTGLSPDLFSSLFSGGMADLFSPGNSSASQTDSDGFQSVPDAEQPVSTETPQNDDLYNTLHAFLTPEQQKIYEQLMHTD